MTARKVLANARRLTKAKAYAKLHYRGPEHSGPLCRVCPGPYTLPQTTTISNNVTCGRCKRLMRGGHR